MSSAMKSTDSSIKVGKKAFLLGVAILFILMMVSGILTMVLPAGEYERVFQEGRTLVVDGSYQVVTKPAYPIWRWFTAPVESLFGPDNVTLIVLIIFILTVSGSITILESAGVMKALISFLVVSFAKWIRWTWKIQVAILIITSAFLAIAVKIGFGPF